ncbi:acylneuraminate cytidylyltransferase family protein [uncultured Pseudodesulfovibrio sp.]|uniref:acylneuraminate cytidylyltransferase family protein n=1 Tax=uncultured Pseudodesulfovibrio sp. TaxID=2035858 RepID=UPI0029C63643|nr:acylneuraminate cytidylyltransferase family protein [uncultured Pseudodesulfovibrio sp.]
MNHCKEQHLTVAGIPARSGSKRLKNKNIRKLNGVPLIAYSIRFAKSLPGIDRVVVNTDSPEYAAIAREYGAETPFLRPKESSTDTASLGDTMAQVCDYFHREEETHIAKYVTLLPTSIFRNREMLTDALNAADEYRLVASVKEVDFSPNRYGVPMDGQLVPLGPMIKKPFEEGCYTKGVGLFSIQGVDIMPLKRQKLYKIRSVYELIDIDTEDDFKLAETVLREGLYDFGVDLGL